MAKKNAKGGGGGFGALVLLALAAFGVGGMSPGGQPNSGGGGGIPSDYLAAYQAAADECPALDWELLAGVGWVETQHGQYDAPGVHSGANFAGAMGPMQFLSSSWAAYGDGGDVYDIDDAAPAAARYLCRNGLDQGDVYDAIYAYNHSHAYVAEVRSQANEYRQG